MKKEIEIEPDIHGKLHFEALTGMRRLQFLLLEYLFFKDKEEDWALPLDLPWPLTVLSLMLHITKTRAFALLKLPCYFAKLESNIVGLLAFQERHESLLIASLGVAKKYRRLGMGTCILGCIEAVAKHNGKKWVEVDVWRKNVPAQRFYAKYGFKIVRSERMLYKMRKATCMSSIYKEVCLP